MQFDETLAYVQAQAAAYKAATDDDDYDEIGFAAVRAILCYAHGEGFRGDTQAMTWMLTGEYPAADEDDSDEEPSRWRYLALLTDEMLARLARHELPPGTTQLYKTWLGADFYFDSADPE